MDNCDSTLPTVRRAGHTQRKRQVARHLLEQHQSNVSTDAREFIFHHFSISLSLADARRSRRDI